MLKRTALLLLSVIILFSFQCRKHKNDNPVDQLPAETQTGAETFGCLVNGEVFKPKGSPFGGSILSCAYQYINGGYYFQLKAIDKSSETNYSIGIFSDSLQIQNGLTYTLREKNRREEIYGLYSISAIQGLTNYNTNTTNIGELKISRFDESAQIVSGTFWFDAVNSNGEKVEVREGRFDLHYTR